MLSLKNITLKPKLIGLFTLVAVVPLVIASYIAVNMATKALMADTYQQLEAIRTIKSKQITAFFDERMGDIRVLAHDPFVLQAFKDLDAAFAAGGGTAGGQFKGHANEKYDAPQSYKIVHDKYFSFFKYYMAQYSYYDIFLISPEHGSTSFTVTKEADFGQRTKLVDSSLYDVWLLARQGKVALSDTKPYAPSNDTPSQFIAAPIMENGQVVGVVAVQLSFEAINEIMNERTGMGETGESYLVGSDLLMRSDSFLDQTNHTVVASFTNPSTGKVATEAASNALAGKKATHIVTDYNGNLVLSAYAPLELHGVKWAIISEIDKAEVVEPINEIVVNIILTAVVLVVLITLIAFVVASQITTPLTESIRFANAITKGDLSGALTVDQKDEAGQLSRALNNMTQQLRAMIATIEEEKERLAVTLRSIGDGVITTDMDGKIVLINKVTEELTGWTQQDAAGRPIEEVFNIINEVTGKACENPVEKVLESGQIVGLANHTALIAKDGTQYIIEDSGAPIFDKDSNIIGTVLVYRDVTHERRIEDELSKVKKLESVGVLAGGIAHDFNNILAAILGNIELAAIYTEPTSEAHPLLINAKKASIRAKDLTQQLLTFAKGGDPVKQTTSIETIVTDSANFVLHGSSVIADYHFHDDLWQVDVDTGQISQVIQNIIINARHAMPDGGVIEVSCQNIEDIHKESISLPFGKYIKLTIADTGSGIPSKFLNKIFDPYFSTKQEGSGLGLAICHSIISKHDGNISVQSETDKGTTFTIYLPASTKIGDTREALNKDSLNTENKATIMVMDDDSMVLDIVKKMLSRCGHEVLLTKNGHEAIELYHEYLNKNRSIDIIIMDLTIPGGMGGKDTVPEILKINPDAKVIVASGYSNDPVMAHYQDYGFVSSIAKPFQLEELEKVINEILR